MKQKMKRVLLALCMAACLFSLSACSKSADGAGTDALDEGTASYITQISESLLAQISSFSKEDAEVTEAGLRKERQTALADGVASWMNVMDDTGSFVDVVSSEAAVTEDGYSCSTVANFASRRVEFKIFYTMVDGQNLEPTAISFTPEYTVGEKMEKAAMNTLMGMGTVFLVLIFISLLIGGFKYINAFEKKMKQKALDALHAKQDSEDGAAAPAAELMEEDLSDDLELAAVITAAIAASTGTSPDGLVVRSIKRAPVAKWKRA